MWRRSPPWTRWILFNAVKHMLWISGVDMDTPPGLNVSFCPEFLLMDKGRARETIHVWCSWSRQCLTGQWKHVYDGCVSPLHHQQPGVAHTAQESYWPGRWRGWNTSRSGLKYYLVIHTAHDTATSSLVVSTTSSGGGAASERCGHLRLRRASLLRISRRGGAEEQFPGRFGAGQ